MLQIQALRSSAIIGGALLSTHDPSLSLKEREPIEGRTGWLGYPRGAWLIIGVEFWERFRY